MPGILHSGASRTLVLTWTWAAAAGVEATTWAPWGLLLVPCLLLPSSTQVQGSTSHDKAFPTNLTGSGQIILIAGNASKEKHFININ